MRLPTHTMAAGAVLLAALALGLPVAAHGAATVPATNCTELTYDVHYVMEVQSWICSFYQPGNKSATGIHAMFYGHIYDWGGGMTDCTLINGSFPGPIVRASLGDMVRVDVINKMEDRAITFHWHGLSMRDYQWADGTAYITSCPIPGRQTTTYIFKADRAGTYFYHGHNGVDEEYGISGALIIDDPADPYRDLYDEEWPETTVTLRDWWRAQAGHMNQVHSNVFYKEFEPYGVPLINGLYGNGSEALPFPVINVAADTCYRLRIILANTEWPGWTINITDASGAPVNMTLIALSAEDLQPRNTYSLTLYIAQRAEVIICTPATPQDLNVSMWSASPEGGLCQYNVPYGPATETYPSPNGPNCIDHFYAIFRVGGIITTAAKTANRQKLQQYPFAVAIDSQNWPDLIVPLVPRSLPAATQIWPLYAGISPIFIPSQQQPLNGYKNLFLWTTRQTQFQQPTAPYLYTGGTCGVGRPPLYPGASGVPGETYDLVKRANKNEVIDIIFQNLSPYMHPMHLHGNRFTVLGSKFIVQAGYDPSTNVLLACPTNNMWADPTETRSAAEVVGAFVASNFTASFPFFYGCPYNQSDPTNSRYMLAHPYETDVVPVPAHSWAYVRVRFDNPGYWFIHCHNLAHMNYGMAFVVDAFSEEVPPIPSWVDTSCGGTCKPKKQFCGPYSDHPKRCVRPSKSNQQANICNPPGFVPV